MAWKMFGLGSTTEVPTVELNVGDIFSVVVSISDNGGLYFRNVACGLTWPVGVVAPKSPLEHTQGNLFEGLEHDLVVKHLADEIGISDTLKSGNSISKVGDIVTIYFTAENEGTGEFTLTKLQVNDVVNNELVVRDSVSEGSASINSTSLVPATGTVIFKVRVVK